MPFRGCRVVNEVIVNRKAVACARVGFDYMLYARFA